MTMRKLLAVLLALTMVLSIPLAVSAEGWELDCTGWWTAHSAPLQITETVQSWTFTSTTYADATLNWNTPDVVVYSGDYVGAANYLEEGVIRSDNYGWAGVGSLTNFSTSFTADWAAWLEANKAGAQCTVTAQLVEDSIVVAIRNHDMTSVYILDNDAPEGAAVNLSLTGELCKLTDLQTTSSHIDISAAVASVQTPVEDAWLTCYAWWTAHSDPIEITEELQSWSFQNTTNADATLNWNTPTVVVYSGDYVGADNYLEEGAIRSDNYGWATTGSLTSFSSVVTEEWATWLEANKAGADCVVTAQLVEDSIVVGFTNHSVTAVYILDNDAPEGAAVNLSMTGEYCVLRDWQPTDEHVDISAAVASLTPAEPDVPDETVPDETVPDETVPDETVPEEEWVVDCPAWWGGHSAPVVVTEEIQSWTFTNTTYETAADNWDTATVVVWRSDDGAMMGTNYLEELLIRSDSYAVSEEAFWGTSGQPTYATKNYPADWAEWLAANKAGAECTVTAQLVDGWIVVGFANNGVVNVYSVPMNTDLTSPVYLSLTGEECTLTGWQATDNHLDISDAVTAPADGNNPQTGDLLPIVVAIAALLSCAGIVVLSRKRMAI